MKKKAQFSEIPKWIIALVAFIVIIGIFVGRPQKIWAEGIKPTIDRYLGSNEGGKAEVMENAEKMYSSNREKWQEAIKSYNTFLEQEPDSEKAYEVHLKIAKIYLETTDLKADNYKSALAEYEKTKQKFPKKEKELQSYIISAEKTVYYKAGYIAQVITDTSSKQKEQCQKDAKLLCIYKTEEEGPDGYMLTKEKEILGSLSYIYSAGDEEYRIPMDFLKEYAYICKEMELLFNEKQAKSKFAPEEFNTEWQGYNAIAECYAKHEDAKKAYELYQKTIKDFPGTVWSSTAQQMVGGALQTQMQSMAIADAKKAYSDKDYDSAMAKYQEYIKAYPASAETEEARFRIAAIYYSRNRIADGDQYYSQVNQRYSAYDLKLELAKIGGEQIRIFLFAKEKFNNGLYDSALSNYELILNIKPTHPLADEVKFRIGLIYSAKGDYETATQYYMQIKENMAQIPLDAKVDVSSRLIEYGDQKYAAKDYEDAVMYYVTFISLFPDHPSAKRIKTAISEDTEMSNALKGAAAKLGGLGWTGIE